MKKIIIIVCLLITALKSTKAQTANIGSDTLQWLKTNIEQRSSSYFSGKSFKTILDSLYQLKAQIVEFDPPLNVSLACGGTKANAITGVDTVNHTYLFVDSLTMYFEAISDGGIVDQIQTELSINNLNNNQNNIVNTHVKYFTVVFQRTVRYPRYIANSENGTWLWTAFAEYYWGPNIIQRVSVGEY